MDKVSIIVPIYNVSGYLHRCINSIVTQTYKNMEILLVDDGSTDSCSVICDDYAGRDDRVVVVHKENGGLSSARNAGIDIAEGEYLMFVDGDDFLSPEAVNIAVCSIEKTKVDMVVYDYVCVDDSGEKINGINDKSAIKDEQISSDEYFLYLEDTLFWHDSIYYTIMCNKLFRKDLFESIRFPEGKTHEDEFVLHYIAGRCSSVLCITDCLYNYVQTNYSIMREDYSVKRLDAVEAFFDRTGYFLDTGRFERMSFSFDKGIALLQEGYERLNRKDNKVKKRLKELRNSYRKLMVRTGMKGKTIRLMVWYRLLYLSFPLACKVMKCKKMVTKR